jgi:hypothetical protein
MYLISKTISRRALFHTLNIRLTASLLWAILNILIIWSISLFESLGTSPSWSISWSNWNSFATGRCRRSLLCTSTHWSYTSWLKGNYIGVLYLYFHVSWFLINRANFRFNLWISRIFNHIEAILIIYNCVIFKPKGFLGI